ncbi:MAG: folate-binding protein, partial [Dolichospermum sp.]
TTANGHFGLGYIKSKFGGVGLKVQIGTTDGEIVAIPFVSHEYPLNKG